MKWRPGFVQAIVKSPVLFAFALFHFLLAQGIAHRFSNTGSRQQKIIRILKIQRRFVCYNKTSLINRIIGREVYGATIFQSTQYSVYAL